MTSSNTNYTQLRLDGSSDPYGKIRTQEEEKIKARKSSFVNPFKDEKLSFIYIFISICKHIFPIHPMSN